MKKILLVLTGGTICSFGDENNNNRDVDISKANRLIIENFRNSKSEFSTQEFDTEVVIDTLSENMTVEKWNILLDFFKNRDFREYRGIIVSHGTDTLAYTASLLSLALADTDLPVFIVSSNLPLYIDRANGNDNFQIAVECICRGFLPGVYVPYRNSDNVMYIHSAAHLLQCGDYSDDFYSEDGIEIFKINNKWTGFSSKKGNIKMLELKPLINNVLYIVPFVGLDYSKIRLEGVRAVVHKMYHSMTACVGETADETTSVLYFLKKCREKGIICIFEPCLADGSAYISGAEIIKNGGEGVYGMTSEMVCVKTLLAAALYDKVEDILNFVRTDIVGEFIYR